MEKRSLRFLQHLLDAPGPSAYESAPASVWRDEAKTFADEVHGDVVGNSYARLSHDGAFRVLIAGHLDEIGVVVTHVDDEGFLWFRGIGGWDDQVLIGQRIRIAGGNGDVYGVIGKKAAHLLKPADRERPTEINDMWIDIGATNRADALTRVDVGDSGVIDVRFIELTDDLCVSRSMDNRVGAFVALETIRLLADDRPSADIYAVATSQEETSFTGAATAAVRLAPAVAIAVDVTHATDYPGADKKSNHEVKLGGGPVLSRGASVNPLVYQQLRAAAERVGMTCPVQASPRSSGTDADAMIKAGAGVATGIVSIPNRYMHSPNEVVSLRDLQSAAKLIAEFVRGLREDTDFRT